MVSDIVVTVDACPPPGERAGPEAFNRGLSQLRSQVAEICARQPGARWRVVDCSEAARREVARQFFNRESIPLHACNGRPFHAFFEGLNAIDAQYIIHFDADTLFGGGSHTWAVEAIALMQQRPEVLLTSPFPGPPRDDGRIFGHPRAQGFTFQREPHKTLAYRFAHASSRIFMIDMNRLRNTLGHLPLVAPDWWRRRRSDVLGYPSVVREPEAVLSQALKARRLFRVDLLGSEPGLWTLHPPFRTREFALRLPEVISRVEQDDVPVLQRGHYDIHDSFVDWSRGREAMGRGRRYLRVVRERVFGEV